MNKEIIRVLVVDDSAFMRKALRTMLESSPRIQVVGSAYSGEDALEKTAALRPDVVTVDLFMSGLGGAGYIKEQMQRQPVAVVVCSSATEDGREVIEAMEAGAIEFVRKPTAQALDQVMDMRADLVAAVQAAAMVPFEKLPPGELNGHRLPPSGAVAPLHLDGHGASGNGIQAVLIGISTGGPRALRHFLPELPASFPAAVIVALHMPPGFTRMMAQKLDELCALEVVESSDRLEMRPGRIILAQAGYHTRLEVVEGRVVTRLFAPQSGDLYCPSVDALFQSGAQVYGSRVLAVVMTGMGDDGRDGSAWVKAGGGLVIAEDERSSIVYGMPRSVVEAGLADHIVPLPDIARVILEVVS